MENNPPRSRNKNPVSKWAKNGLDRLSQFSCANFVKKYFLQGQQLNEVVDEHEFPSPVINFIRNHRKFFGVLIPFLFFTMGWWSLAIKNNYFQYFPTKYFMSITMVFGATIAGATSEGGGAVAFPVMTMAFNITPSVARDFSLMIQTCGMTAASFTIFWMHLQLEFHSIIFCSLGGVVGLIIGFLEIDHRLTGAQKKMGFVSIFFAFAIALFILNREKKRRTFNLIPRFNWWKALVLLLAGAIGGTVTAVTGSGVDICSFSILTLLFHISEKVATPTSVVLMAINTSAGFYIRHFMLGDISEDAWEFLAVCVPIVVLFAPMGSFIASHFHRQVLASMIYILETVALVSGFVIVKPGLVLSLVSVGIICVATLGFVGLSKVGRVLSKRIIVRSISGTELPLRRRRE